MSNRMGSGHGSRAHVMTMKSNRGILIIWGVKGLVGCALAGALALTACTPAGSGSTMSPSAPGHPVTRHSRTAGHDRGSGSGHGTGSGQDLGCPVTIHGVIYEPGLLLPIWLPTGFRHAVATRTGLTSPTETYTLATRRRDPPRIEVGFADYPRPFARFSGGRPAQGSTVIQGHPGRLESGPPAARLVSVYWKPDNAHLLSVTGYKVSATVVVAVARNVWFDPPGLVPLPLSAGRIISKNSATGLALRASDLTTGRSFAKLSSWSEVAAMLQAGHAAAVLGSVPGALAAERWQPVWIVLVTDDTTNVTASVLIDAATGHRVVTARVTTPASGHPAWFSALTDRSRITAHSCQGGSRARLPFGVLTRDEESFVVRADSMRQLLGTGHARMTTRLKLTTVPAMNGADPGIYGGCVQQSCSIDELVWVTITKVRAVPGTTMACPPQWASNPPAYRPSRVEQYFKVSVPGNYGIYCASLPSPLTRLKDLSPPLRS